MENIFLITKNDLVSQKFETFFKNSNFNYKIQKDKNIKFENEVFDIVLIDVNFDDYENIIKKLKNEIEDKSTQFILLVDENSFKDTACTNLTDGLIFANSNENILKNAIKSYIQTKKTLNKLSNNNRELSKSLYQINALYNTSSQFIGTLDKEKLCDILYEGLEKILSYDLASILLFTNKDCPILKINSINELSESLTEAIKIRLSLKYNSIFDKNEDKIKLDFEKLKTIKNVKFEKEISGLNVLNYDTLFSEIKVNENFFGVIEIARKKPFLEEDVTCFQTIINQFALPYKSATLYEEIKETNKKLEKLEHLKSDFVSIVSHELRTPLTPIKNSLDIILSGACGEISDDSSNFLNIAKRNVERLSQIIEDLLDLSRIQRADMGKLDFHFKKTDIVPSVKLVFDTLKQSNDKNIDLTLSIKEEISQIYSDTKRFEQILTNLISNAIKFTNENGKIEIKAEEVEINRDLDFIEPVSIIADKYVKISVKDTGIGILKEDIPKIFDKFLQVESSLKRTNGGIGLGLHITKHFIDKHFGLIRVESEKNKGSTFEVYLPVFSDKIAFRLDFDDIKGKNAGIIYIKQNEGCDFVNYIVENNILKKTNNSKEFQYSKCGFEEYFIYYTDIDAPAFNYIKTSIKNELKDKKWKNCDIVLEGGDSADIKKIDKIINKLD